MKPYNLTASQFANAVLLFKNNRLSLDGYRPFKEVYDTDPQTLVLKAGRQIGKSLSLAAILTCKSILRPYFNTLFIAPLQQQTSRFSTNYLDTFISSPLIKKHYMDTSSKKNVFQKGFNNGSIIFLGYAETEQDADRIRGVNADNLNIDEVQDVSFEALPVLYETLSASQFAFKRLTGTAKGENNTLELVWKQSNQLEWVTKCDHCGKYSIPFDFDTCMAMCRNDDTVCCAHCAKPIDVTRGKWVSFNPSVKDSFGFHLPQIIFESRTNPRKWKELKDKLKNPGYTQTKIANEVFGLAAGAGNRILTIGECIACSNIEKKEFDTCWPRDHRGIIQVVMGIDWSVTGGSASYTVITIIGSDANGKVYLLYAERLNGIDIVEQVKRAVQLYYQYDCQLIASDRGVGVVQWNLLEEAIGVGFVWPIQYVASKTMLRWDKQGRFFAADRTMGIDSAIMKIKMGQSRFESPCWSLMEQYYQDALAVYEEETMSGRKVYRKDPDKPDDWIHSLTFANIGLMILREEYTYVELKDD